MRVDQLDRLTRPLLKKMEDAIDTEVGFRFEHGGFLGLADSETPGDIAWQTATNEECASISMDWFECRPVFDLRLNLPQQFAEWLREQAANMERAAAAVENVDDDRNLNRITAIIGIAPQIQGVDA